MMPAEREDLAAKGTNASFAMTSTCVLSATTLAVREATGSTSWLTQCSVF